MKQTLIDAYYYSTHQPHDITLSVCNSGVHVSVCYEFGRTHVYTDTVPWNEIEAAKPPLNPIIQVIDKLIRVSG